jgi:thioredoxin 1
MAMQITDANAKELFASGKLVVVDFWATWCGPCQHMGPIVEQLATEYEGRAVIGKYNVDENEELAAQIGVRNIPTFIFVKDNAVVGKVVGAVGKAALQAEIEKNL